MFNPKTDTAHCPHCHRTLSLFDTTLNLWQCDYDRTVYSQESFVPVAKESHSDFHELQKLLTPDMTLADSACPVKGCD